MSRLHPFIEEIRQRLPELAWQLERLAKHMRLWKIPKGVFRSANGATVGEFMREIEQDIEQLEQQNDVQAQNYLAKQLEAKINLLSRWVSVQRKQASETPAVQSIVRKLMDRRQWLLEMEGNIAELEHQIQVIREQLDKHKGQGNPEYQLELENSIGRSEQKLCLMREHYQRATSFNNKDSRP